MMIGSGENSPRLRNLGSESGKEAAERHISSTLDLIETVAAFFEETSRLREEYAKNLQRTITNYELKTIAIEKEKGTGVTKNSAFLAWSSTLGAFRTESELLLALTRDLHMTVNSPLAVVLGYKKSEADRVTHFRKTIEAMLLSAEKLTEKYHEDYINIYDDQKDKYDSKSIPNLFNGHNKYLLQMISTNQMAEEYHYNTLPYILDDLENLHIEASNSLIGVLDSFCSIALEKTLEMSQSYQSSQKVSREVNCKEDIIQLVRLHNPNRVATHFDEIHFSAPDEDGPEILQWKEIINDKMTESTLKLVMSSLQKEFTEISSYIRQNEDVADTLQSLGERWAHEAGTSTQALEKAYEMQDDICRKRGEIREAYVQLAGITAQRAKEDMFSKKRNKPNSRSTSIDEPSPITHRRQHNSEEDALGSMSGRFLTVNSSERNQMVHQKSSESQDSTASAVSAVSMLSLEDDSTMRGGATGNAHTSVQIETINSKKNGTTQESKDTGDSASSPKHVWKKAFFSLRRDKSGKLRSSLKKKESKSGPVHTTKDEIVDEVDPIYHLLRCAASKGQSPPVGGGVGSFQPTRRSESDSPSPASASPGAGRLLREPSLSSNASTGSGWARRKAVLNSFRMKSVTGDDSMTLSSLGSRLVDSPGSPEVTPPAVNKTTETKDKPSFLIQRQFFAKLKAASMLPGRNRLDSRMKSFSMDSPECHHTDAGKYDRISTDSKKKSTSFTNTNLIESPVPASPRRRKHLYGRKKSFSVEQEGQLTRRVEFDEESLLRKNERRGSPWGSPQKPGTPTLKTGTTRVEELSKGEKKDGRRRSNWRMKSFSLDAPDSSKRIQGDTSVQKKKSVSPLPSCFTVPQSPPSPSESERKLRMERRSGSLESSATHRVFQISSQTLTLTPGPSLAMPTSGGSPSQEQKTAGQRLRHEYRLSGNLYIVLYDFIARHRDELDLKAGWKVSAIETSDPDWWTGKCNGRVGFFPSAYVQRIRPGDQVWRVAHQVQLTDEKGSRIKFFRGQIVVQVGPEEEKMIPISHRDGSQLMCPEHSLSRIVT